MLKMKQNALILLLIFIIFSSGCLTTDVIQGVTFTPKQYINASDIIVVGATASGSLQNISDLNQGYYNVTEGNAQPFYVIVNFTNITNFSFLEAKAKYFSTSGTPSSHVVDLEIWCTTDGEYEDLFFLENAIEWRYFTRHFPDSMHFIDAQGNVSVKFNHSANGNVNHRLWIDTVRLITSAQYEQNIITTNQYFNTTGTGGASNLSQLTIDTNKNWMNYSIYNISLNHANLTNLNWSVAGHIIDTDVDFKNHTILNSPVVLYTPTTTFYVNKSGSDSNNGSQTYPFLTIAKALTVVAERPVLTGSVIIQIGEGTWNENIVIPALQYGFYNLTIQGTLNETYNQTATGGGAPSYGTNKSYGFVQNTSETFTSDAYKDKLLYNYYGTVTSTVLNAYVPIVSNNATSINYTVQDTIFTIFNNTSRIIVKDWNTTISNTGNIITLSSNSKVILKNIKLISTNTRVIDGVGKSYTETVFVNSYVQGVGASIYVQSSCAVIGHGNIFKGTNYIFRVENNCVTDLKNGNTLRSTGGTTRGLYGSSSVFSAMVNGLIDGVTKTVNSKGFYASTGSSAFGDKLFFENLDYSAYLDYASNINLLGGLSYDNVNTPYSYDADFAGAGNAYMCLYANGSKFRGSPGC